MMNPSPDETLSFIEWHSSNRPALLTAIHPEKGKIVTEQFAAPFKAVKAWLAAHREWNLYYHVNAVPNPRREGNSPLKANKGDVAEVRFLHVDVDPPESGTTKEWYDATLAALRSYKPAPSTIVFSGNGFNALWRLKAPVALENADIIESIERYNWALALDFKTDVKTRDISRVLRLPGTVNWPTKAKQKKGWTTKKTVWVEHNDTKHDIKLFRQHDGSSEPSARADAPKADAPKVEIGDTKAKIEKLDDIAPLKGKQWAKLRQQIEEKAQPGEDRSDKVWAVVNAMVRAGCDDNTIARILLDKRWGIAAHVLDQPAPRPYATKQIAKARAANKDWVIGDKGIVANHPRNIATAIGKLGYSLSYDEFSDRLLFERNDVVGQIDDNVIRRMWFEVDAQFHFRPAKEFFFDVVMDLSRKGIHHPVREYLDKLTWDGKERLSSWLIDYGAAADTAFNRAVGRIALIAAVRRVREPGVKFDEALVLESEQGLFKSSAINCLAVSDDWFSDDLPFNADTRMVIEQTRGRWLIEASELQGMRKGEIEHIKAFLSRRHDRARLAYGRVSSDVARQFIVIGTTNSSKYLMDHSGNRRFWPVKVGRFDVARLKADRDQLWAEANAAEKAGESIRLDEAHYEQAGVEQRMRKIEDDWTAILREKLGSAIGKILIGNAWRLLGRAPDRISVLDSQRLANCMQDIGFTNGKRYFKGEDGKMHQHRAYSRGEEDVEIQIEIREHGEAFVKRGASLV